MSNENQFSHEDLLVKSALDGDIAGIYEHLSESYSPELPSPTYGFTPVIAILRSQNLTADQKEQMLDLFIQTDVDFDVLDAYGYLPTFVALEQEFPVALKVFNNADVSLKIPANINLLMAAASLGLDEVIEFIHGDFDINEQDDNGNTALHHAIFTNTFLPRKMEASHAGSIVETLCAFGADTMIENVDGKTPLEYAYEFKMYDVALALKHCGLPKEGFRKIKVKFGENEEPTTYYVHLQDSVLDLKRVFFQNNSSKYNFYYPRFHIPAKRIMEDDRNFSDYGIQANDVFVVQPKIKAGLKGGKTRRTKRT